MHKRNYYGKECVIAQKMKNIKPKESICTIYPHFMNKAIAIAASSIETVADKKLVALSSSELRARVCL